MELSELLLLKAGHRVSLGRYWVKAYFILREVRRMVGRPFFDQQAFEISHDIPATLLYHVLIRQVREPDSFWEARGLGEGRAFEPALPRLVECRLTERGLKTAAEFGGAVGR